MKRGEVWTVSGGADYTGKPRPPLIVQDDAFEALRSVTICAFTSDATEAPMLRILVDPDENNGLRRPSRLMVDKITTVPRSKVDHRVGALRAGDLARFEKAALLFLGFGSAREE